MELVDLHCAVVEHIYDAVGISASFDLKTIRSRAANEGPSFFQKTLPLIGKLVEASIESGRLDSGVVDALGARNSSDKRPKLFYGLFSLVFAAEGELFDHASTFAIKALRQVFLVFQKIFTLPHDTIVDESLQQYVQTERELTVSWSPMDMEDLEKAFWVLFPGLMSLDLGVTPRHGSGAVAEKITSNMKYNQRAWTDRLERYFPASDYVIPSYRYWQELETDDLLEPGQETPIRVSVVPKTATAARVIGIEPWYMQYVQQGLFRSFTAYLDSHRVCSYSSQLPNQELARVGSRDRSYATLDLSEASDRVHNLLVVGLFKRHHILNGMMQACRSQRSKLPNGDILLLKKFASMGSALTFPVESMVFSAIAFLGICRSRKLPITRSSYRAIGAFRVFGDDMIVPTDSATTVIQLLETFGLKVNQSKTFINSLFRESCGADWYAEDDVSLVRMRRYLPESRQDVAELVSIVSFRNLFTEMWGLGKVTSLLDTFIEGLIPFPAGYPETPALCRCTIFDDPRPSGRRKSTQDGCIAGVTPVYYYQEDPLEGSGALLKYFLSKESPREMSEWSEPVYSGKDHLLRSGRPVRSKLRYSQDIPLKG